jgi:TrpR-related protein YerC/YecD
MGYVSKFKTEETELLFQAILSLEDSEECYRFFEDVCTINELHAMSQRFYIAKLLLEGKTYQEIEEITKASTATISRINKCCRYGAEGYKIAVSRLAPEP